MSYLEINEDFTTNEGSLTLTGSAGNIGTRSGKLYAGNSTAVDAQWQKFLVRPKMGSSRKALKIWASFDYKIIRDPTGAPEIFNIFGQGGGDFNGVFLDPTPDGSVLYRLAGLSGPAGSAATDNTAGSAYVMAIGTEYHIDVVYQDEGADGAYLRAWIAGTLRLDHRILTRSLNPPSSIKVTGGLVSVGKYIHESEWDNLKVWTGADPQ